MKNTLRRATLGSEGGQTPLPDTVEWLLPDGSDNDENRRTGVLSTSVEIHALVLDIAIGVHTGVSGDVQRIADIIGIGAAGSRVQKGLPDKYREQITAELPYFIAGIAIGYGGTRYGPLLAGLCGDEEGPIP